ncbi:MAG: Flagellar protein FliS [Candidatus Accumulibacter appositus]|uniref:Flagellar secretion chaperone FliS n=1 Tax=Candidatus Accumulibacter appositus TaxID=1454003 RepID=A0A011PLE2_9PROT|nr:flagellar export chaperone FliS [Accumulibacter sp.]EXI77640.1 MAG: Flagellar protein FliS [Candidatus Accumulibacter appositus]HRF03906.1 flagellar export chaperone FliS [Accumulibacter sp.]
MFGHARHAISAYQKVGVDAAVEVADPHRLILLLFAGAQAAVGNARAAMQEKRIAAKGEAISKAIDIIGNGLKVSLDLEQGGEIAERLDALYDYLVLRLLHANLDNDLPALEEVSALLEEIHGAWREISPNATTPAQKAAVA